MSAQMKLWAYPRDYMGDDYSDYYVLLGHHRDSTLLTESNFYTAWERIKAIPSSDNWEQDYGIDNPEYQIVRSSHWLVGWAEFIGIHKDSAPHVEEGNRITEALDDYPVLNDSDYYEREHNATIEGVKDSLRYAGYSPRNVYKVYRWLDENMPNELESHDDTGGYPSKESIIACAHALKMRRVK